MVIPLTPAASGRRRLSKALFPLLFIAALLAPAQWTQRILAFQVPTAGCTNQRATFPGAGHRSTASRRLRGLAARGGADDDDDDYTFESSMVSEQQLTVGKQFEGVVTSIANFGAFVDIGFTIDGLVPKSKLQDARTERVEDVVQEGQGVTVWVSQYNAGEQRLVLSMSRNRIITPSRRPVSSDLSSFKEIDPGEWLTGEVVNIVSFGAFVAIRAPGSEEEAQGLVHVSQMEASFGNVYDAVSVGDEVKVRVLDANLDTGKMRLSMLEDRNADLTPFVDIPDTEWLTGKVVSTAGFGAFVSVEPPGGGEAAQGLVHISQIKDGGMVMDVSDEVAVDQEVKVRVVRVDVEGKRLSLSMRESDGGGDFGGGRGGRDLTGFEGIPDTEWLTGKVRGFEDFGAFVEVTPPSGGPPASGLVHVTQIKEGFVEDPQEELELDQEVRVRILECDLERGRLALSLREVMEGEDEMSD